MERGAIWWASLPEPTGSTPGYRRPVLIIQTDEFNRSRINTIITIILTSNLRLADAPGNILLAARRTGLPKDAVANVSQIYTIDKSFLTEKIATISPDLMAQIDEGLRLVMAL